MLSILLINDNKIVSRLLKLSSQKHNYDLEEIADYNPKKDAYNILFVDNGSYDSASLISLISRVTFDKVAFIADKGEVKPEEFDLLLEKPFLPTDFVNIMNENFKVVDSSEIKDEEIDADIEELEELDLDALDEIDLDETLVTTNESEQLEDEIISDEPIETNEQIADVLADIDELDDLKLDESQDIPISVEENESIKQPEEKKIEDSNDALKSVAAGGATVAVAAVAAMSNKIDSDEIDTLEERDMKEALGIEVPAEEIIEEKIVSEGEERVLLETPDMQKMIEDAIAKTITKEFIQDAIKDMDIVISFRKKEES